MVAYIFTSACFNQPLNIHFKNAKKNINLIEGNLMWAKLKSSFSEAGRLKKESGKKMSNKLINVNEEYKEVFRTKSYVEMWNQVRGQQEGTECVGTDRLSSSSSSSSSPTLPIFIHLSDYLFEAQEQQTITEMMERLKSHKLLLDYFESSTEACDLCDLLLKCIHQTWANYRRIKRVLDSTDFVDENKYSVIFKELAQYASLKNPLSYVSAAQFGEIHDKNVVLLRRLTSEQKKIRKRAKRNRIYKKVGGYSLVISHSVLLIALLVVAIHGLVGIVAVPGVVACSVCLFRKKMKTIHKASCSSTSLLERQCSQLDLAAKGMYILINDFDTMSRLVRRLSDEIEHQKALADMCARNKKVELLKEVVKEICARDMSYMEQLEELEEHIYLCFHTMNRSRRLIVQGIMMVVQDQLMQ